MSLKAASVTGPDFLSLDHRNPLRLARDQDLAERCNAMVGAARGAVPTAPRGSTSPQDRFQDYSGRILSCLRGSIHRQCPEGPTRRRYTAYSIPLGPWQTLFIRDCSSPSLEGNRISFEPTKSLSGGFFFDPLDSFVSGRDFLVASPVSRSP
jgi:hypothetical protein